MAAKFWEHLNEEVLTGCKEYANGIGNLSDAFFEYACFMKRTYPGIQDSRELADILGSSVKEYLTVRRDEGCCFDTLFMIRENLRAAFGFLSEEYPFEFPTINIPVPKVDKRIDLRPVTCDLCNGRVKLLRNSNKAVNGSKFAYVCQSCGAYVGTYDHDPTCAKGIISNAEMRRERAKCHRLFDRHWKMSGSDKRKARSLCYQRLAEEMHLPKEECHFSLLRLPELLEAEQVMETWQI